MKKYEVLVDAIVEGQTVLKGTEVPNGGSITFIPDLRAQPYVEAGILKEIVPADAGEVDASMLPNPPVGSQSAILLDGGVEVEHRDGRLYAKGSNDPYVLYTQAEIDGLLAGNAGGGNNDGGVIDAEKHSKDELLAIAGNTPNAVFQPTMTKAQLADAINTAIATNAANAARGNQT